MSADGGRSGGRERGRGWRGLEGIGVGDAAVRSRCDCVRQREVLERESSAATREGGVPVKTLFNPDAVGFFVEKRWKKDECRRRKKLRKRGREGLELEMRPLGQGVTV
ncbi:hypothetical protein QYF36_017708 [Acer negundo]|nr:hypothetical protein QYF36_017708 [Acer negundo]